MVSPSGWQLYLKLLGSTCTLCGKIGTSWCVQVWRMSALLQCSPKITNDFKGFILTVTIRSPQVRLFDTRIITKTTRKSTRSYSFIAHSFATQGFPVIAGFIYWFSLHSCQNGYVLFVTQYDNNTFPTQVLQWKITWRHCQFPEFDGCDIVYCKKTNTMIWTTLQFKKGRYGRKTWLGDNNYFTSLA